MAKVDRKKLLESLAAHIDPQEHRTHIEAQQTAVKTRASQVMIAVQQLADDPHAGEVEKSQLEKAERQLESLLWQIEDLDDRLAGLDKAHVASVAPNDGPNRAQRRSAKTHGRSHKVEEDGDRED